MDREKPVVLVVDDIVDNVKLIYEILRDDYSVKVATDGEKALEVARNTLPDIILMDIMMPVMNGYEACRRLKEDEVLRDVPILFLTAKSEEADEERGFALGASDFIVKPVNPSILMARIKTHLDLKRSKDVLRDRNRSLEAEVRRRTGDLFSVMETSIVAMASLAEMRDTETGRHLQRTKYYIRELAEHMGEMEKYKDELTPGKIAMVALSSPLHDIGKIGIPDSILLKPGPLTSDEYEVMKQHPTMGRDAIVRAEELFGESANFLSCAREIIYSHHEKWDGTGYPQGLSGEDIPLPARLMAVVDAYDALTSKRVYKDAVSHEDAVSIIKADAGKHFDPDVVNAFLDVEYRFEHISKTYTDVKDESFARVYLESQVEAFGQDDKSIASGESHRQMELARVIRHHKLLLDMLSMSFESKQEQLDYALHQLLQLSQSQYGYIYLYDEEKGEFTINSWTRGVMKECNVKGEQGIYQLSNTGIWGEVVRQRRPIIENDFARPNPLKKGYPEGHVRLKNFMSVPVFIDDKIVAVVGLANKRTDYDHTDVDEMRLLMSGVWNAVERRESTENLIYERNKYYQTLKSIGDGVMAIGPEGNVEFINAVASRLTGWVPEAAEGKHYRDIFNVSHEQEGAVIEDAIEKALLKGCVVQLDNHAVLTSRTGERYFIEDSAAPILGDKGAIAGVVLVFRDVTEKRRQREEIEYMSFHDVLTGLYNRRFFEVELRRLDTQRNLPISMIMGDIDGLKFINDIFGHAQGDALIREVANTMKEVCRADDIVARWGGDEFALLLPKTCLEDAKSIAMRIQQRVFDKVINEVGCSISMGCDTKTKVSEEIMGILGNAETKMYSVKTLRRKDVQCATLEAIKASLYEIHEKEGLHAESVSKLCVKIGMALKLAEDDIKRLSKAAYYHDIGNIALYGKGMDCRELEQHTMTGYRILNFFDDTQDIAEIVLAHHEHWDGTGFPKGLKGEEIPLLSRIIAIAEAYDYMCNTPLKGERKTRSEAIGEIRRCAGTRFDPKLAEIFVELLDDEVDL